MKKWIRLWMLAAMVILGAFVCTAGVSAASAPKTLKSKTTGWKTYDGYKYYYKSGKMQLGWIKVSGKCYYLRSDAEGDAPAGSMVTGLYQLSGNTFYFSKKGVLQTGWKKVNGKYCYFRCNAPLGKKGVMYTGFKKVKTYYYLFGDNGNVQTGWTEYNGKQYYFNKSTKLGVRGRALTGWHKIGNYYYYFNSKGLRLTSQWISNKYYVDAQGRRLTNCVTPDGYIVNKNGVKGKAAKGWIKVSGNYYYYKNHEKLTGWQTIGGKTYYFDSEGVRQSGWLTLDGATYYLSTGGVMQTGWVTVSGNDYYFQSDGKMAVSTTVDDREIGADGVAAAKKTSDKPSVLIIAGHGQGDIGASATYSGTAYQEYKLTRQLATLVYTQLKSSGKVEVEMYDQNYNYYKVNYAYQTNGEAVGPLPDLTDYDYVFEIHFNAAVASSKDLSGDGSYKGIGIYLHKKTDKYGDQTKAKAIIKAAVAETGFAIWGRGNGLFYNSNLLNAKTCYNKGVSYGLLETAFIDDKDDITFYLKNKDKFGDGIAKGILTGLGVS